MNKFRWGYVGSGSIAAQTARQIVKGDHIITSVYSRTFEKAEKFAKKYDALAFDNFEEMLDAGNMDAVYIATPHTSHVEYAIKAMERGIPVLWEKPVGVSVKDVEQLVSAAKANNVYFCEAMWTWFSDVALTVKDWIQSGEIGAMRRADIYYAFPGFLMGKNSRVLNPNTAGGALLDVGIYPITYCYNLFGEPKKVTCEGTLKNGIDYGETIVLEYEGFQCTLHVSFYQLREVAQFEGENGSVSLPVFFHAARKAILENKNGKKVYKGKTDYLTEFTAVAEEIKAGKKESDYIPFASTIANMKIMDECRKQMGLMYPFEKL